MPQVSGLGNPWMGALGRDGEHRRRSSLGGKSVRLEETVGRPRGEFRGAGGHSDLELRLLQPSSHGHTSVGRSPQAGRWARKSTGSPWRWHRWA